MSHSYENFNSSRNTYLNKKRLKEPNQIENRHYYEHYDKYGSYDSTTKYSEGNNCYSKSLKGNYYYNSASNYRNDYNNGSKSFYNNRYKNNFYRKKDYKKSYTKGFDEGIRNISNCDMISPQSLCIKEDHSLKSFTTSTAFDSKTNLASPYKYKSGINIKELNKLVSNITGKSTTYHDNYLQDNQENLNNEISAQHFNKEKDDFGPLLKIQKFQDKLLNYEFFDKNSLKIKDNHLENFEVFPKNLYNLDATSISKIILSSKKNETTKNNDDIKNDLSIKSSYLLSKIPNWRLVSRFVPISSLKEEKFEKILEDKESGKKEDKEPVKKEEKDEEKKSVLVYSEKYEDIVDKYLEENRNKKNELELDSFNIKSIIEQYHFDIFSIKNRIRQNKYEIDYLTIKNEKISNAIKENKK